MPLFAALPPELPATLCATFDWDTLRPAERTLASREVTARIEAGVRPEKLAPLSCTRGRFKPGRFVDESGTVYRLRDVTRLLAEVPDTRADLRAYREARLVEAGAATAAVATATGLILAPAGGVGVPLMVAGGAGLGTGVLSANASGSATAALARALTTYNATSFWSATEQSYTFADNGVPTSVARATELVLAARSCTTDHADPAFKANAQVVWRYAGEGFDAGALVQASELAPADTGCDLAAVLPAGFEVLHAPVVATPEAD